MDIEVPKRRDRSKSNFGLNKKIRKSKSINFRKTTNLSNSNTPKNKNKFRFNN